MPLACFSSRQTVLSLPQDIYTLFHLHRDFKFISKTSNFLIPIIGWSMFLTGASSEAAICLLVPAGCTQTMLGIAT